MHMRAALSLCVGCLLQRRLQAWCQPPSLQSCRAERSAPATVDSGSLLHSHGRQTAHEGDEGLHLQSPALLRRELLSRSIAVAAAGVASTGAFFPYPVPPALAIGELPETLNQTRFVQHAVVNVPDLEAALKFYLEGLDMKVLRSRTDAKAGTNTTFVGYGSEQLTVPKTFAPGVSSFAQYGGHFSLELVGPLTPPTAGSDLPYYDPGNGFQYLQIAVDNYRISKVLAAGGKILSGYGFLEVVAPGGLRINLLSGERRDPMMFVALKVKDIKKSISYYTDVLGMTKFPYPKARSDPNSMFEPKQPNGSVFLAYNPDATGVLLIPADRKDKAPIKQGAVFDKLALLGSNVEQLGADINAKYAGKAPGTDTSVAVTSDADGYTYVFVEYIDFTKELP